MPASHHPHIGLTQVRHTGDVSVVLVVDDEPGIVEILTAYLQRDGFEVVAAGDGIQALETARQIRPDLVVLDLTLPGLDGYEVFRELRRDGDMPVIMLTAKTEDTDKLVGLGLGADDYVTKPFNPQEVVARAKAVLRRTAAAPERRILRAAGLECDLDARVAAKHGRQLELTALEFDLLATFLARPGMVFTREQLLERCWGTRYGEARVVDVHIANLRKKIEDHPAPPQHLLTVRGVGYKFST